MPGGEEDAGCASDLAICGSCSLIAAGGELVMGNGNELVCCCSLAVGGGDAIAGWENELGASSKARCSSTTAGSEGGIMELRASRRPRFVPLLRGGAACSRNRATVFAIADSEDC